MAMGVMEIAAITRTQDFTTVKQNEDNRSIIQQSNMVQNMNREEENKPKQVAQSENAEWMNKKFDAREKGNGSYSGNGGENRKKRQEPDGVVKLKSQGGFDIKI